MGNQNSDMIVDQSGKQVTRKCIILVIPPGFQVHKMLDGFPQQFPYRYVSVGEMIRNQINKKTKYSKIILEALQKNKKISKQLLEILLKTVALRGNFIIRYSVLDSDQLAVWKQFMSKVQIQMIAIVKSNSHEEDLQIQNGAKQHLNQRYKAFQNDVRTVKSTFQAKTIKQFDQNNDIASQIMAFIRKNNA